MDFPSGQPSPTKYDTKMLESLGIRTDEVVGFEFCPFTQKALLHISDPNRVSQISPNFITLPQIHTPEGIKGVIITAQGMNSSEFDFISRYFAPWKGINEDPVTGSAHVVLAKYWAKLLNKSNFHVQQVSTRTGVLDVYLTSSSRVLIKGTAKLIVSGKIFT